MCVLVRFFLFFQRFYQHFSFENSLTLLRNGTSTWLRRVKYYKHIKSDLCYNIKWGNRRKELAGEQKLIYLSPLQLKATVELVAVSQLSLYQPVKAFLLQLGIVVNPFQRIPGYIGSGIPLDEGLFWKFLILILYPDRLQGVEVIQKNCYQSIILVTWRTEMPWNAYSWQNYIEDKIVLITERYQYWGLHKNSE